MLKTAILMTIQLLFAQPIALAQESAQSGSRGAKEQPKKASTSRGRRGQSRIAMPEVRLFPIRHMHVKQAAVLINELTGFPVAHADNRTNSIIYSGPAESVEKVEKLLQQLDVPVEETLSESEITVVPISERSVNELTRQLSAMNIQQGMRTLGIVGDESRSRILLNGPSDLIAKAQAVIAELDIPAGSANLEFAFFKARLNADVSSPMMPADLEPLVKELQRFGRLELLGQLSVVAVEDMKFAVSGSIGNLIHAEVEGQVQNAQDGGSVKVWLDASMMLEDAKPKDEQSNGKNGGRRHRPEFRLRTVVSVPRGDYVVLGSAPNGWEAGESAILVMRAQPKHPAR